MANDYSVAIHNYISDKIAVAEKNIKISESENDLGSLRYYQGQLMELKDIRGYMAEKIDLKTQRYF